MLVGAVPLVRVLWRLGVRHLLLGFPATSLVASLPVGCSVRVSDHINLTGANPLFGHNEDRYGARFPDCSTLYSPPAAADATISDTTSTVKAASVSAGCVLASVSGWCDAALPCERRWLSYLGAELVVRGQAADAAIVARQMDMRTTAVAVVAHCAAVAAAAAEAGGQGEEAQWLPVPPSAATLSQQLLDTIETALRKPTAPDGVRF